MVNPFEAARFNGLCLRNKMCHEAHVPGFSWNTDYIVANNNDTDFSAKIAK